MFDLKDLVLNASASGIDLDLAFRRPKTRPLRDLGSTMKTRYISVYPLVARRGLASSGCVVGGACVRVCVGVGVGVCVNLCLSLRYFPWLVISRRGAMNCTDQFCLACVSVCV